MSNKFIDTPNWSTREYVKNMTTSQTCHWMAFLKALTIVTEKAQKLGLDPDSIDIPNIQMYNTYIKPESETIEYWLSVGENDPNKKFFLDDYFTSERS